VFVGYKGYDKAGIAPLFPFGHGLSYTSFGYSDLQVTPTASGLTAAFTVTNTGSVAGSEVPQVYVDAPADPEVPMPVRSLVGYERVKLAPGQAQRVTVPVDVRELSYWSIVDHAWRLPRGARTVEVGSSSRDLRLKASNATAGVFNPRTSRAPDKNGYYTAPVVVSGQTTGAGTCTPVTYSGPEGTDIPVTVSCVNADGTVSTNVVRISYDATPPAVGVATPAKAKRAKSWRVLTGTANAGAGSPVASVRIVAINKRGGRWTALVDGKWVKAKNRAKALAKADDVSAIVADGRWSVSLGRVRSGRLQLVTTATDVAGNAARVTTSQRLRR
jgi:hypothetical protein